MSHNDSQCTEEYSYFLVITLTALIDDAKCYELVRQFLWPEGVVCAHCESTNLNKRGKDETQPERQRYRCQDCAKQYITNFCQLCLSRIR